MDLTYDSAQNDLGPNDTDAPASGAQIDDGSGSSPQDRALVDRILRKIKDDKRHHAKAFKRMRRDMQVAMWGAEKDWGEDKYRANIAGRHVKQKTAALYAKNPKISAKRREQLDFAIWDENPQALLLAMQVIQAGQQAMTQPQPVMPGAPGGAASIAPSNLTGRQVTDTAQAIGDAPFATTDPGASPIVGYGGNPAMVNAPGMSAVAGAGGAPGGLDFPTGASPLEPALPPGFDQAMALVADFQQGYARRMMYDKIGKTLELLFMYSMDQQQPYDFKRGMKVTVRRTNTTGVGYAELGFQRQMGPRAGLEDELADAKVRLDHLQRLAEDLAEGEYDADSAERAELEHSVAALQSEPLIVLQEGLIVEYPASTKVIPDKLCKALDGFIGARHLSIEYIYTPEEVEEIFGVDLKNSYTSYTTNAGSTREISANDVLDDDYEWSKPGDKNNGMVCVWKHYDKPTGLVYYVADGYEDFLRAPAPPDVFVETFWPVFALTFNAVESEDELFPPSDVSLMLDQQKELNRSRYGKREHRDAARPRWVAANGSFGDEEDPLALRNLKAFELQMLNMDPQSKIGDILQTVPVPGVDPNLYDTGEVFADVEMVVGSLEAQFGGTSKATATEASIAASSTNSADGSSVDDLDAFLTLIARAGGQILQKEMSEESVRKIVGPGALWPAMTLEEIAGEIQLEVAAGSTGKPNQAVEINNLERILPLLLQMPEINKTELARETLRRLDDRMDLTKMIAAGMPSIVSQNQGAQPAPAPSAANPVNAPALQGPQGAANAPMPSGGPGGSSAHFGSNQVPARV